MNGPIPMSTDPEVPDLSPGTVLIPAPGSIPGPTPSPQTTAPEVPLLNSGPYPPAIDPTDLVTSLKEAMETAAGGSAAVVDLRLVRTGWEVVATVRTKVFGGDLGIGASAQQEWGGQVNAEGRVNWTKKW